MINLIHDSDNGQFNIFMRTTYIGRIRYRCYKKRYPGLSRWFFEADLDIIPDTVLSEIEAILRTLNL